MLTLKQKRRIPAGGFSYKQPETGITIQAYSWPALVQLVINHRKANNLPVPVNIEDLVEEGACKERPEQCHDKDAPKPPKGNQLTLQAAARFTKTLVSAGSERATADQAMSRAHICSTCEDNITPVGCEGCRSGWVRKTIELIVGARKTPYDKSLKSCKHCGCFNAAQIWIPVDALQKTITEEENAALPDHCWKKI